jgi:hypothetical protein
LLQKVVPTVAKKIAPYQDVANAKKFTIALLPVKEQIGIRIRILRIIQTSK